MSGAENLHPSKGARIKSAFSALKTGLKKLKTLTVMQLKEKLDLSFVGNFRKSIFKTVWFVVEFAAVSAACWAVWFFVKTFGVFSLVNDIPVSVISVAFTIMLLFSVISATAGLVKALYLSRDNQVLLTFPASPSLIFLSKLAVYFIYELRKNILFLVPLFMTYGIVKGFTFFYYPWLLFLFVFISALPIVVASLLSMPTLFVVLFIKKYKSLQYVLFGLFALAIITAVTLLISKIPANIDLVASWGTIYWDIQAFLKGFAKYMPVNYALTELVVGRRVGLENVVFTTSTVPYFFIMLGVIAFLLGVAFLLSRPLFYNMASKPFEYSKKVNPKLKRNVKRGVLASALRKELSVTLRDGSLISMFIVLVVVQPIAIQLLNKVYSAMNTRFLGAQLTVGFNVLIMLLISLSANIKVASVYSRDGFASYLNKVQPTAYAPLLFSKIFSNMLISFLGTSVTVAVYSTFGALTSWNYILLALTLYGVTLCHILLSAEMDIMRPQSDQYATFSEQSNNPNENKSAMLTFLVSLVYFVAVIFFSLDNAVWVWLKIFIVTAFVVVLRIVSYLMKIKVYYQEKQ